MIKSELAVYKASLRDCGCTSFLDRVQRKKELPADVMQTSLKRCLNTFDLALFGIAHMIGGGIYVLAGVVAQKMAGPGVVFSYIIAGLISVLIALCYAEFGSKIPKTGSAYMYTYVMLGECWAYLVGWDLVLEQVIGVAAVARVWSGAINVLSDGAIVNGTIQVFGTINTPLASHYPDMMAVTLIIVQMIVATIGVKFSSIANNILTVINVTFLTFTIIAAFVFAQPSNWVNADSGGVLPFGVGGVLAGAATCFFSYVGFEGVTQAAEEATNPARSVPLGTIISMTTVTVLYVLASLSLTMLVPYYNIDLTVPFAAAFADRGASWLKYVTAVGMVVATTTTALAGIVTMSRLVYALAQDKVFFAIFSYVNPKTQTPIIATVVFCVISMIAAAFTDIDQLAEMLSAGTLMAFNFLSVDVLILRYLPADQCPLPLKDKADCQTNLDNVGKLRPIVAKWRLLQYMSTHSKFALPKVSVFTVCSSGILFFAMVLRATDYLMALAWWAILLTIIFGAILVLSFTILLLHTHNTSLTSFQVPLIPWIPAASILLNSALLVRIPDAAWIRVAVWDSFGFLIYFVYGFHHSVEAGFSSNSSNMIWDSGATASNLELIPNGRVKDDEKENGKSDQKHAATTSPGNNGTANNTSA